MTTIQPDPIPTQRQQLSQGGYAALLTDHCQLVEQFEHLMVVVVQLWEMNNTLREALHLPRQRLPIAARLMRCDHASAAEGTTDPSNPGVCFTSWA